MIPRKKKICKSCGNEKYIFGKGLCDYCYKTKQKKIKPISESHKKTLNEYKPTRVQYWPTFDCTVTQRQEYILVQVHQSVQTYFCYRLAF